MKHRSMFVRSGAFGALIALALAACGSGAQTPLVQGSQIPAGRVLTPREARAVPKVSATPTETPTVVPGVVAQPTVRPKRPQGPPGNPQALSFADPPAPGRYPHQITIEGDFGTQIVTVDVDIKGAESVPGGRRQIQLWDIEDFPQQFTYGWTQQRLLLERVEATNIDGSRTECDIEPPSVQAQLPMSVGKAWDIDYKCDDTQTTGTSEVIRTERVRIGDTQTDTFVIETIATTTSKDGDIKQKTRTWYAPKERLFVIVETESKSDDGTVKVAIDALSLTPRTA